MNVKPSKRFSCRIFRPRPQGPESCEIGVCRGYNPTMDLEWLRQECLSLPHTTEHLRWEDYLVFKVGGKMYAIASFEPGETWLSLKSTDEDFYSLADGENVIPAPHLARAKWIALTSNTALPPAEVQRLLRQAHSLIFAKLPRKTQEKLTKKAGGPARTRKK